MKYLKNERGVVDAAVVFLIGLVFTFVAGAVQQDNLKTQIQQCEAKQNVVMVDIK